MVAVAVVIGTVAAEGAFVGVAISAGSGVWVTVAVGVALGTTFTTGGVKGAGLWHPMASRRKANAVTEVFKPRGIINLVLSTSMDYTKVKAG